MVSAGKLTLVRYFRCRADDLEQRNGDGHDCKIDLDEVGEVNSRYLFGRNNVKKMLGLRLIFAAMHGGTIVRNRVW